jgi:3-methyladenine DNA glycosylase/8-oxoguanine DNA glycosylase
VTLNNHSIFTDQLRAAARRLARRDPVLGRLIKAIGPCTLLPLPDAFQVLSRSIVSQLISTKAAITIYGRLEAAFAPLGVTPAALAAATEERLRAAGLSRNKARGLLELAARVHGGVLPIHDLASLTDDEVTAHLLPVHSIGKWTAEMFLIFGLGRLDVLPVDDMGLRAGVQQLYGLDDPPGREELRDRAEAWRPFRTVATWYFWRSRGAVPQSNGSGG